MLAYLRAWIDAIRLARRIQRGELMAVPFPPAPVAIPVATPVVTLAIADDAEPAPIGRYEITVNGMKVRWRGDDGREALREYHRPARAGLTLALRDTAHNAIRAQRTVP